MAYQKRTFTDSPTENVTYKDCNRWEDGISANYDEIELQKNATVPGTLAKKIADINTDLGSDALTTTAKTVHGAINEHEEQINVLNTIETIDISNLLLNGITRRTESLISRTGKNAQISLTVNLNGFDLFGSFSNVILYLPERFRPITPLGDVHCATDLGVATLIVKMDGAITRGDITTSGTPTWVCLTLNYLCNGGTV